MKSLLIFLGLSGLVAVAAPEYKAEWGNDWVRITPAPCVVPAILKHLEETKQSAADYRDATGFFDGVIYRACWTRAGRGMLYFRYEDGDTGLVPLSEMRPEGKEI